MSNALRLPAGPGPSGRDTTMVRVTSCSDSSRRLSIRLPATRSHAHFASFSVQSSQPSIVSSHHHHQQEQELTSAVGSSFSSALRWPPLITQQRHVHFLTFIACSVAVSATWLFFSAIPTLLAFKRAAESMEKLMDVTREELPGTMAAVRLSGMEISDLTMELSDLGQEITQGVRSSTRAVRLAEERLRRLTNTTPIVTVQEVAAPTENPPALARTARGIREGIVKGRAVVQMFFTLTRYSKILLNYFKSRGRA